MSKQYDKVTTENYDRVIDIEEYQFFLKKIDHIPIVFIKINNG
jgi:hypothetical protein